jgi:hypothetical protein
LRAPEVEDKIKRHDEEWARQLQMIMPAMMFCSGSNQPILL